MNKAKALQTIEILKTIITNPQTELNYSNDFELLVAVVLSAQCTDKRVNMVTPKLFEQFGSPQKLANADLSVIEQIIKPCGFYKSKAKNLVLLSQKIIQNFNGQVPKTIEELVTLNGVGQKTANVMLVAAFNEPGMPVDTHVFRVSNRLGYTNATNVKESEKQLRVLFKDIKHDWVNLHHYILLFGRYYCKAQNPKCDGCVLAEYCKYVKKGKK